MKKLLAVLLVTLIIAFAFVGCSSNEEEELSEGQITTADAIIKESEAIHYIQDLYTPEELGLADVKDDYSFMIAKYGVMYDDERYVKVVANVVTEKEGVTTQDGEKTYSMTTVGEYLISFDGKKVLSRDMSTADVYTELESKTPDYSAKGDNKDTE